MVLQDPKPHFAPFYLLILANDPAFETTELVLIARRVLGHGRTLRRVMWSAVDIKKIPTPPAQQRRGLTIVPSSSGSGAGACELYFWKTYCGRSGRLLGV